MVESRLVGGLVPLNVMILDLMLGTVHPPIAAVLFSTSHIAGISFEKVPRHHARAGGTADRAGAGDVWLPNLPFAK